MDYGVLGLFHPLEENFSSSFLTVGILCFVFLGCNLKCSSEFACLAFLKRDISTVILILECYNLVKSVQFFPNSSISDLVLHYAACYTPKKSFLQLKFLLPVVVVIVQNLDPCVSVGSAIAL
jgi:hypothetical protein